MYDKTGSSSRLRILSVTVQMCTGASLPHTGSGPLDAEWGIHDHSIALSRVFGKRGDTGAAGVEHRGLGPSRRRANRSVVSGMVWMP